MSSSIQPFVWKRYLTSCECLGYEPEETVGTNSLQLYKTLYTRYCKDNGLQFDPTRNLDSDVDIKKLSELLYHFLSAELGCQSILQIRRNLNILMDQVFNQMISDEGCLFYHLGSRAEGFRIKSDSDHMNVLTDNVVVNNTSEISELSFAQLCKAVITMETQYTKPGYVRLILETDKSKTCLKISSSCHNYDDKLYISSTKFREYMMSRSGNEEVHGPCTTTAFHGDDRVYDIVYCLSCTSQPSAVQNWVMRCNEHNWPDSVVLEQCISLGCQLAPVGSKESPHEHLEWRISFILMENAILQSLSHSQFMCYGLLKLYLIEVLGSFEEINDLVSSYFMKTVLLWEIQTNSQYNVGADNLLQVFLNCLQRLYTCVKTENCPNFFIPENNMFENRIYGESKYTLQNILELLFTEKFHGLYRCQTIDIPSLIFIVMIYEKQSVVVSLDESMYVTDEAIEADTWNEINAKFMYLHISIAELDTLLKTLELILTKDSHTDLEKIALQAWISKVTVYITIHDFKDIIAPNVSPDIVLEKYNSCCNIFRTHDHKGSFVPLYLATLMYITGRYHSCLDVIIEYIKRLKEGHLIIVYVSVKLQLTELRLELESTLQIEIDGSEQAYLLIDPSLYVSMLSVLCHYHLGNVVRTEIEFQLLRKICSDMRYMKDLCFQEISWQILGICAEIIGKYDEAYQSYVRAYNSRRFLLLDNAPLLRLLCLIYKLLQK